jgi:heme-degrading monooxygenase HmoA
MNQVMEMLRLAPGATEDDAVARLSTLFDMMSRAGGFHEAEVLRSFDEPGLLMVLHTWDSISDWTAFQTSDTKMAFSASRPAFLYNFEPCGMNWLLQAGEAAEEGAILHRQVLIDDIEPLSGPDVVSSQTFSYQDYEPLLAGAMLRLTRTRVEPASPRLTGGGCVIADDVFESLHRHKAIATRSGESVTAAH